MFMDKLTKRMSLAIIEGCSGFCRQFGEIIENVVVARLATETKCGFDDKKLPASKQVYRSGLV